jgi:trehalose 6-phosphate synthase
MHLSRRLPLALLAGVAGVSLVFATLQALGEMHTLRDDVQRQALVLAESQAKSARQVLESGSTRDQQAFVDQFANHERLAGIALYDGKGRLVAATSSMETDSTTPRAVRTALLTGRARGEFYRAPFTPMHILALPIDSGGILIGVIGVFYNVGYTDAPVWRHALTSVAQTFLIVAITLLIVRWSLGSPLRRMTQWLRDLRIGHISPEGELPKEEIFQPLASEVTRLASTLNTARAVAQEEARLRDAAQSIWTAERLRISLQSKLQGSRLFAVSNREPYEHSYQGAGTTWSVPPSGLVTALEPVLRACDGIWIAQGTGAADHETADALGRLRVPPDQPQYTLRRVWLDKDEQEGFYFGFANEGLWPLCHIAHTRPVFRARDWEQYHSANRKFADALLEEMSDDQSPLVLAQDYHFALLPRMIKEKRPDARVAIFWHIPWPNPEAFGICPWQRELLDGMLGADLIGFHIQAHCNNFLETVDRALESRIDWGHFTVNRQDHMTAVRPFPISVAFGGERSPSVESLQPSRAALLEELGINVPCVGLGVDRIDYTKGIPERFRGIERLLERHPSYRGSLVFIQIGAPSRTHIKRYQDLMTEVEQEADRINRRFRSGSWKPILLLCRHHSHREIQRFYRAADFCLVTSLHDGMNLVAKEYIAARDDERGALILSRFTGACHELADALAVNPYDTDELAEAVHTALTMPTEERRERMRRMRAMIREHNVYRWAGDLISELAKVRLETAAAGMPEEPVAEIDRYTAVSRINRAAG